MKQAIVQLLTLPLPSRDRAVDACIKVLREAEDGALKKSISEYGIDMTLSDQALAEAIKAKMGISNASGFEKGITFLSNLTKGLDGKLVEGLLLSYKNKLFEYTDNLEALTNVFLGETEELKDCVRALMAFSFKAHTPLSDEKLEELGQDALKGLVNKLAQNIGIGSESINLKDAGVTNGETSLAKEILYLKEQVLETGIELLKLEELKALAARLERAQLQELIFKLSREVGDEVAELKTTGESLVGNKARLKVAGLNLNELRALSAELLNLSPENYASKLRDLEEGTLRVLVQGLLDAMMRLEKPREKLIEQILDLKKENISSELSELSRTKLEKIAKKLLPKDGALSQADIVAVLELVKLRAVATKIMHKAIENKVAVTTNLKAIVKSKTAQKSNIVTQLTELIKKFPGVRVPGGQLALDKTADAFATPEDRWDAIINDINNDILPETRYHELLHEHFYKDEVLTDKHGKEVHLVSSRTFLAYSILKLKSLHAKGYPGLGISEFVCSRFLECLKLTLGQEQFALYLNTPLLLPNTNFSVTLKGLYTDEKYGNLNVQEREALKSNQNALKVFREYKIISGGKSNTRIDEVNTHNISSHKSADESHVKAFRMMVEANSALQNEVEANYSGLDEARGLHRNVEILKGIPALNKFVEEQLKGLSNEIQGLIGTKDAELYDKYLSSSVENKKDTYNALESKEKELADKKINGLRFQAKAAKSFVDGMVKTHWCTSVKFSYRTNIAAACGLTMEQMVATCYWASKDKKNFHKGVTETLCPIIRQLYDMVRGYNIHYGEDKPEEYKFPKTPSPNKARCPEGCTNSLASAGDSIHKAYNVRVVKREDIEEAVEKIYEKEVDSNIEHIRTLVDDDMLKTWSNSGMIKEGKVRSFLKSKFDTDHYASIANEFKGYISDKDFSDVIKNGLNNVNIPKEFKQKVATESMSLADIYTAIANNKLPILNLDVKNGYDSTLNYLTRVKGQPTFPESFIDKAIRDAQDKNGQVVLLYLSRSKLGKCYQDRVICNIAGKDILLKDIAALEREDLSILLKGKGMSYILKYVIEHHQFNLFSLCASKIGFTQEILQEKFHNGITLLHFAAGVVQIDILESILKNNPNQALNLLSATDNNGKTPLESLPNHKKVLASNINVEATLAALAEWNRRKLWSKGICTTVGLAVGCAAAYALCATTAYPKEIIHFATIVGGAALTGFGLSHAFSDIISPLPKNSDFIWKGHKQ